MTPFDFAETPFDLAEGNLGAMTFILTAYTNYPILADKAFFRMESNGITGYALYMLWNDCCGRDTEMAIKAAFYCKLGFLKDHINKRGGRGLRISSEDIVKAKSKKRRKTPIYFDEL